MFLSQRQIRASPRSSNTEQKICSENGKAIREEPPQSRTSLAEEPRQDGSLTDCWLQPRQHAAVEKNRLKGGERAGFVYKKEHQSSEFPGWVLQRRAREPGESCTSPPPCRGLLLTQLPGSHPHVCLRGGERARSASSFECHFLTVTRCRDSSLGFPFDLPVNDSRLPPGTKQLFRGGDQREISGEPRSP